ncbi:penicillin-binding protein 1A [Alkalihalobacillus alcalophilus ATCC 27647 = CGMCC 1.3604]|uniref:Penicillin-binding protein n=1 Tax=Alkalihalobacillus alcalophilus ATCC 27647 = CGMCC 1.3604 TaxID=1218173 RepID=A0A094WIF5_ALKAL|nr:transglycosylase domain-containing protein [Alkalihalobacillus alcalophilus]KGA96611.1 penicillin-binding protein [Alkalihalobacillus alcalophilus ATCC 27647 = CGMCC 1.3604]MED1561698.1 transglycosylase domain-containing protein [Alkalihalobacillus alcalophilus]THG92257.1 penicillin-binding protein 1A [Alkalihalobacillus alcalophilus ATCC 27647 = CGMCC 1.3604]
MKKLFSTISEQFRSFTDWLHRTKIIRSIGITYQVLWNLLLIFIILGAMSLFFAGGAFAGYFASLVADEPLRSSEEMLIEIYDYEETSEIYFANDEYLGKVPTELEREEIPLEQVSEYVIQALIATEDEHFFEHEGIVPKAILRATLQEFANSSVQTGGSTITQQLIKQQILTSEVSFDRKATEILLAMRLEQFMEKEEILEAYLNVVPFGRNASGRQVAGVQAAAEGLFGVDASELNIPQAAFIAGLPQSPFGYTPFTSNGDVKENFDAGLNRMRNVLTNMYEVGYITEEEYQEALTYDIRENLTDATASPLQDYPYLTNDILRRATEILAKQALEADGIKLSEIEDAEERTAIMNEYEATAAQNLRRNGYKIHTTINKELYDALQVAAVQNEALLGRPKPSIIDPSIMQEEELGVSVIENSTGAVLAFVGGRDEKTTTNQYNFATTAVRQTGSTMKPLLGYAPGMDYGTVQPGFVIPDTPENFKTGEKGPISNYEGGYRGLLTVRESLHSSRNIPAVRAFNTVPHELSKEVFDKLGFYHRENALPESTALGPIEMTVEQNVNAYATFANGGKFIEAYMIETIETKDGKTIYEHEINPVEVYSPQTSYLMIDMLRGVLTNGTASRLSAPNKLAGNTDWAGKTGTTSSERDYWFVATSPKISMGIWYGYEHNMSLNSGYNQRTLDIWANLANTIHKVSPELLASGERFQAPDGIVSRQVCTLTGTLPSKACQDAGYVKTELFNSKFVPSQQDNSGAARYVTIDGRNYKALDSTPSEFTEQGITVSFNNWNINNISQYLPDNMKNIVPNNNAPDNGNTPGKVSGVKVSGSTLSWSKHGASDIVGYRIYQADNGSDNFSRVASVKMNTTTSHKVSGGSKAYYVTAVDTRGNESPASDIAKGSDWVSAEEKEKKAEQERQKREEEERQEREEEERRQQEEADNETDNNDGDNSTEDNNDENDD